MPMPFELRIALRYLTARRKQAFISVISAISVLGVVVGVMALMVALGLMTGLQRGDPHARSSAPPPTSASSGAAASRFDDYREVVERGARACRACWARRPPSTARALLTSGDGLARWPPSRASCPREERTVTDLAQQVEEGRSTRSTRAERRACRPILLGRDLASDAGRGRRATWSRVTSPQGRLSPDGHAAAGDEVPGGGHGAQRPLRVRLGLGLHAAWPRRSGSSPTGDRASLVEVRIDDIYAVREVGAGDPGARWATATSPPTGSR